MLSRLSGLLRQLEPGRTATVIYLVVDPHGGGLILAGAGHPPPLVYTPGDEPRLLDLPGSVPLGATRHVRYEDYEWCWSPARCWCSTRTASSSAARSRWTTAWSA